MKENYTHISLVIDRSGSMHNIWKDTMGGVKSMIATQKKDQEECTLSITFFNHEIKHPFDFVDIQKVTGATIDSLQLKPSGNTALVDAICMTVKRTGEKIYDIAENDRPDKVLVIVQTDGYENASREYSSDILTSMIDEQRKKYSWDFMFVGATEESVISAIKYGFNKKSISRYATNKTEGTFDVVSNKVRRYKKSKRNSHEFDKILEFSDEEKNEIN